MLEHKEGSHMTTKTRLLNEIHLPEDVDIHAKCFHCGAPFNAMWQGSECILYVCTPCAVDVLPRVIADAVVDTHKNHATDALACGERVDAYYRRTLIKHGVEVPSSTMKVE
jgi:hypothetical protein